MGIAQHMRFGFGLFQLCLQALLCGSGLIQSCFGLFQLCGEGLLGGGGLA